MRKMIGVLGMSLLMLASCTTDESSEAGTANSEKSLWVTPKKPLLKKSVLTNADGSVKTLNFTYVNTNKLATVTSSEGYIVTATYSGNLITRFDLKLSNIVVQSKSYTYDSYSRLKSYTTIVPQANTGEKETYNYNPSGSVSIRHFIGTAASQTQSAGTGTVTFQNGEVKKIQTTYSPVRTYTFDSKINPFKNVLGFNKIAIANDFTIGIQRNVTSEVKTENNGVTHSLLIHYNYGSTYYPVSSSHNYDGETSSMQYFY
jgi:hypothetical protein